MNYHLWRRYARCAFLFVTFFAAFLPCYEVKASLVWETHFVDEDPIADGQSLLAEGANIEFSTNVFSDNAGDLLPGRNATFFSFEAGQAGTHFGYLELSFDNNEDDPDDYLELTIDFLDPVSRLSFSILDIDGSPQAFWDDAVEIYYNGINVRTDSSLFVRGPDVFFDNETGIFGFESGSRSADPDETNGNVDFDFGTRTINQIRIRYLSTDDAVNDPAAQFIGISDLAFVPEPGGAQLLLLAAISGIAWRRTSTTSLVR